MGQTFVEIYANDVFFYYSNKILKQGSSRASKACKRCKARELQALESSEVHGRKIITRPEA